MIVTVIESKSKMMAKFKSKFVEIILPGKEFKVLFYKKPIAIHSMSQRKTYVVKDMCKDIYTPIRCGKDLIYDADPVIDWLGHHYGYASEKSIHQCADAIFSMPSGEDIEKIIKILEKRIKH